MPGEWITNRQVETYMNMRSRGHTQDTSAAKAGISERSGRDIEHNKRRNPKNNRKNWRTRRDPLEAVWANELVPMLESEPRLTAITLLEHLQSKYSGSYPDSIQRTLQRRVKAWRAEHGPAKEVIFRQKQVPGLRGLSDFTTLKQATITIAGRPFKHILYHFRLAFSRWSHMKVVEGGESFTALAEGLQEALWRLGGSPKEHRTDSLSAAYKNLAKEAQEDITSRYESVCKQYSMTATRNNPGACHENGSVESAHGHVKSRIHQALLLRGNCDFPSIDAYQSFIDGVVQQHNRRNAKAVTEEKLALQPLPLHKGIDYTEVSAAVSTTSTIEVRRVTYTVPSRLQGEMLRVRLYDSRLKCYLGCKLVIELKRLHPKNGTRARQIDYRHVIDSLVKKPQAFYQSVMRNELLPSVDYHAIWDHLVAKYPPRDACRLIVGLLHLAAQANCEQALASQVLRLIHEEKEISLTQLQANFKQRRLSTPPPIAVKQHDLMSYNQCIPTMMEIAHA